MSIQPWSGGLSECIHCPDRYAVPGSDYCIPCDMRVRLALKLLEWDPDEQPEND